MSKTVRPIIEALFTGSGHAQPVTFEWRLICRRGRPFMLLPGGLKAARTGLNLYSAQRRRAKIWRNCLPVLLQTPLAGFLERISFDADGSAEIMQFLAQQAGVPVERVFPAAIKVSEVGDRARVVVLLCDEGAAPSASSKRV